MSAPSAGMPPPAFGPAPSGGAPVGRSEYTHGASTPAEWAPGAVHGSGRSAALGLNNQEQFVSPTSGQNYIPYIQHTHQQPRCAARLGQTVIENDDEETQSLLGRQSLPPTVHKVFSTEKETEYETERARLLTRLGTLDAEQQMKKAAHTPTPIREPNPLTYQQAENQKSPRSVKLPPPTMSP